MPPFPNTETPASNPFDTAYAAGLNAAEPKILNDDLAVIIVPPGCKAESHDLTRFLPAPRRTEATVKMETAESFCEYFQRHQLADSVVFAEITPTAAKFTGIIDQTGKDEPRWRGHRVVFATLPTIEWARWTKADGSQMSQEAFAEFLEDNLPDLVEGAALLEVSRSLQARKDINFKQALRLDNGDTQLIYEETTQAKAGQRGEFEIPKEFDICLPLFVGAPPSTIRARLRYRIESGRLNLWFELLRPHKAVQAIVEALLAQIIVALPGVPIYRGQA